MPKRDAAEAAPDLPRQGMSRRRAVGATASSLVLTMVADMTHAPASAQAPLLASTIAGDERVDFFTTSARLSDDGASWLVPVHARVYRPARSTFRLGGLSALLKRVYGVDPEGEDRLRRDSRLNLLLGDNKPGRRLVIELAGERFTLPPTGPDGHVVASLTVPAAALARDSKVGRTGFSARLERRDARQFAGTVLLVPPVGRSVISDIDDTIKITHVTDTARMMQATFAKPFEAVPGMARAYRGWAAEGAAIHYVSSTPWHLYRPLVEFLDMAGFPPAAATLKKIRLKDSSIANILADATVTKPPAIEAILQAYPHRTFVLIGDSGEKDPEIYADVMRRHPSRIESILIRNVTGAQTGDARISAAFAGLDPARWRLFADAAELPSSLAAGKAR